MIKFTDNEKKILSTLSDTDKTFKQICSIYAFYLKRESMSFILNLKKHYKDYFNKKGTTISTKISFSWFEKITRRLIKSGLIITKKQGRTNTYSCPRIIDDKTTVSENMSVIVSESEVPQTIENTDVKAVSNSANHLPNKNYININHGTVSLDTATLNVNNKAYREAIERNNKDRLTPSELSKMALNRLKHFKRRGNAIKLDLLRRLNGRSNVVRANALRYIDTVIADCVAYCDINREKYAYTMLSNKYNYRKIDNLKNKPGANANFTQRDYDYNELEQDITVNSDRNIQYALEHQQI